MTEDLKLSSSGDLRFELYGLAISSHIARIRWCTNQKRDELDRAEELATWGLHQTIDTRHPSVFLDLTDARALARTLQNNHKGAIEDLNAGLDLAVRASNYRLQASTFLRLSQAHLKIHSDREAASYFNKFKELEQVLHVKTADVVLLAEQTERMLAEPGRALVLTLESDFEPDEIQKEFQRFLVEWARSRTSTDAEAAEKLNISRQTLYKWIQK